MVITEDVFAEDGRKLLPRGTLLNEGHVKSLKSWGIEEVSVGKEESTEALNAISSEIDPEQWKVIRKQVEALFSRSNTESSIVQEMMRLCGVNKYNSDKKVKSDNGS